MMKKTFRKTQLAALTAVALFAACGGPDTIVPPPPPQTVDSYWVGVEQAGAVHLHIEFIQSGTTVSLKPNCFLSRCSFLPFNSTGITNIGSDFPVEVKAASGTFNNPNITFNFTLANNRTFTFTGRVGENKLMTGKISGATLPETTITFEKRE